ncbi:MAG: hypothetical protein Q9170_006368 [Blastenia crenularia]
MIGSASRIRAFNPKVDGIHRILDGSVEAGDSHIFPLVPPPSPHERPDTGIQKLHHKSPLCKPCLSALTYFAYVTGECRSKKSTARNLGLLETAVHHESVVSLFSAARSGCHLCGLLSGLVGAPGNTKELDKFFEDTRVEICWSSRFDEKENFERDRIQFAETDLTREREPSNYFTFARLQIWPAKEFGHLFTDRLKYDPVASDSGRSSTDLSDTYDDTDSCGLHEESRSASFTSEISDLGDDLESSESSGALQESGSSSIASSIGGIYDDRELSGIAEDSNSASTTSSNLIKEVSDTNRSASWSGLETASSTWTMSEDSDNDSDNDPRMLRSSTGSASSRQLATQWLSNCRNNKDRLHNDCRNLGDSDWLPTRLINVRQALTTSFMRLVSPHLSPNNFIADRRYVTLSHCWGSWGPGGVPVLNVENERDRFDEGIALKSLPRTFREAIQVADWFEGVFSISITLVAQANDLVPWLWIDSLCIIQDDPLDWQREALQMHSVYARCYLNISADCAVDARDGLFQSRTAMEIQPLELGLPDETIYLTLDERNMFDWINDAPLSKRAWVFQERHLARRIIHFTQNEIVWECCAKAPYFASETFPNGTPLRRVFDNKPKLQAGGLFNSRSTSPEKLYDLWEDVCQMYSEKNLSKTSDKLIALSGLATLFQERFPNDTYIAGMWLSTLPQRLLWVSKTGPSADRIVGVAPSWSWASINGPINNAFRVKGHSFKRRASPICQIDFTHHKPRPEELIPDPQNHELAVHGFLRRVTIDDNLLENSIFPPSFEHRQSLAIYDGQQRMTFFDRDFSFSVDSNAKTKTTEADILFLTLEKSDPPKLEGLLLHETFQPATFERIGTFSAHGMLATALKYTVREDVEDWEAAWKTFKVKYNSGEARPVSSLEDSMDLSDADDSDQSDTAQDGQDENKSSKSSTEILLRNLTLESDRPASSKGKPALPIKEATDGDGPSDQSEPSITSVDDDDSTPMDTADITAVLYAHENAIDNDVFEKLIPENIRLI